MSQWAEIRQMHVAEGVSKKEIARRLQLAAWRQLLWPVQIDVDRDQQQ